MKLKHFIWIGVLFIGTKSFSQDDRLHFAQFQGGVLFNLLKNGSDVSLVNQYLGSKIILWDRFQLDGFATRNFETYHPLKVGEFDVDSSMQIVKSASLFSLRFSVGKQIGLSVGYEWGERYLPMGDDTIQNRMSFVDSKTQQSQFIINAAVKQRVPTYALGVKFSTMGMVKGIFETDEDKIDDQTSLLAFDVTFEALFSPTITYDSLYALSSSGITSYGLNNVNFKKGGFRMIMNVSNSHLGFHQEVGVRPGIHYINTEKKVFDGFYVMMGFNFNLQFYDQEKSYYFN